MRRGVIETRNGVFPMARYRREQVFHRVDPDAVLAERGAALGALNVGCVSGNRRRS